MTRANNWRSIGQISRRMASFKSFNVPVCECKHAFQITPKEKITRWKIGRARGPRHVSETGNEVPGKHVSNNGHWPSLHCQPRGKECRPPCLPPRPTNWVLPIQKMSSSRGSPVLTISLDWAREINILSADCTQFHNVPADCTQCSDVPADCTQCSDVPADCTQCHDISERFCRSILSLSSFLDYTWYSYAFLKAFKHLGHNGNYVYQLLWYSKCLHDY